MISRHSPFYRILLDLARAGLAWEYFWPALWPATALAGLFAAAALFNLFALLPIWLHLIILILFLTGFGAALRQAVARRPGDCG